jgi:hypothetical protein
MPSTALPAPEIEIGFRLPVNCSFTRILTEECEPVHKRQEFPAQVGAAFFLHQAGSAKNQNQNGKWLFLIGFSARGSAAAPRLSINCGSWGASVARLR